MNDVLPVAIPTTALAPTLLLVDDEANILASLRRLFRPFGYQIHTASSAKQGLASLERQPFDLVISDMRMPEMNGAQFLKLVHERWPDTVRLLLTGYADLQSTVDAINDGRIYRYVAKPWQDEDMLLAVRQALDHGALRRERAALQALTQHQNERLAALNASLEDQVAARTEELSQTVQFLEQAQDKLHQSFQTVLKVFANLLELRHGSLAGHGNRVAELARRVGHRLGLNERQLQELWVAGLLHGIGKIGLPDALLAKPHDQLTLDEREQFMRHPLKGEMALTPVERFAGAARIVRHQHEQVNGSGFPDGLSGEAIPLGARILATVRDFELLRSGLFTGRTLPPRNALAEVRCHVGTRYDEAAVTALAVALTEPDALQEIAVQTHAVQALRAGMRLAEDLRSQHGVLLLAAGHTLNEAQVQQLARFERLEGASYQVIVHREVAGAR